MTTAAVLVAAGSGSRMGIPNPKQYAMLAGRPVLIHSLRLFLEHGEISRVVVVTPAERLEETKTLCADYGLVSPRLSFVPGGLRRQDSVLAGLKMLAADTEITEIGLVHDGARPLVTGALIDRCLATARQDGAAIAAIAVQDTLKRQDENGRVAATIDRENLWRAQTPQAARFDLLMAAFARFGDTDVTDEAALLQMAGVPVTLVSGERTNIKITRPEDLALAEKLLAAGQAPSLPRIGHGYDAHRFVENRALVLAGVSIPHSMGLAGHSDADAATHALCDAILGALALGDIGRHFPDTGAEFKDIRSILLLERVMAMAASQGYRLNNADITIICQAPKLAPLIDEMRTTLAGACNCPPGDINIKATTTEKMGFTGRGEGIACHAVALLRTQD
jgi:2-C-methyl-D-erythritol 4-phosphate cytidylyltransferase/2-C-methyl-D-erythritol 2,4-cyclodiphosphate synthase